MVKKKIKSKRVTKKKKIAGIRKKNEKEREKKENSVAIDRSLMK
jgi:hypothetical protein